MQQEAKTAPLDPNIPRGRNLVEIKEVEKHRPAFNPPRMRHLIACAVDRLNADGQTVPGNGLAPAIIKVGARPDGSYGVILIDLDAFDAWIETQRLAPLTPNTPIPSPPAPVNAKPLTGGKATRTTVTKRKKRTRELATAIP